MKDKRKIAAEAAARLNRIIDKTLVLSRTPRDYGTGDLLFLAEIHVIDAVGKNRGINITNLAKQLGVTKGTVSPIANKLERKGYLRKWIDDNNRSAVQIELTEKGEIAKEGFGQYYQKFDSKYAADITFGQYAVFNEVLAKLESFLTDEMTTCK